MTTACDACLRRSWLIARLSGRIELARHQGRRLREVLALPADVLLDALAGDEREAIEQDLAAPELADQLRAAGARSRQLAICRHDPRYPARLTDLADAPAVVWLLHPQLPTRPTPSVDAGADTDPRATPLVPDPDAITLARLAGLVGGDTAEGARAVAIVGTRRASADGLEVARAMGRGLAAAGVTVVSGMALGVDGAAHAGALDGGGRTVAVLACGADVAYPRSKQALHRAIARDGLVVSELPPGTPPRRWTFPARNRIIAALAQMTLVIEAAARSGSLITAECASDLGREVAALPGPVLSWRSDGTNGLLRDGATLVRHAADVLDAVVGLDRPPAPEPALEPRLRTVLKAVSGGRDTVSRLAGGPDQVERALRDLTELELLGLLRRAPGGRYVVVPR
jgi:DNA processing protein